MSELKPCPECVDCIGAYSGLIARQGKHIVELEDKLSEARAERTCRVKASYDTADVDNRGSNAEWYFALTCGCELYWDEPEPPNYCPNCGARVIGTEACE